MIVNNLKYSINGRNIIDNISFVLSKNDKVGLTGVNGSGKSTLLRILSGLLKSEGGTIKTDNETIEYLKQEIEYEDYGLSIIEYVRKETKKAYLEEKLSKLELNLDETNMEEYSDILNEYLTLDGYNFESNFKIFLNGLNIKESENTLISTLSGGEKIKVLLLILLMKNSDVILLDEPTNNLDLKAIKWLENYLKNLDKKMIIVSHDEEFLNMIANRIFELNKGSLKIYNLKYADYLKEKEEEYKRSFNEYNKAKEEREKLKKQLQKAKSWVNKGYSSKSSDNDKIAFNYSKEKTNTSNITRITKSLDNLEIPDFEEKKRINFDFIFDEGSGNKDIELSNLVCGYDSFKTPKINLVIPFGSRVSIMGSNGSGKTTFIKTLLHEIDIIEGKIIIGNDVKFGYISQDTLLNDNDSSIISFLTDDILSPDYSYIFTLLDKFNIDFDDKDKPYNILSPGERTRVNLVKLALNKINVLVLDEITNHLDKEALELIYDLVCNYKGTVISISHNRKYNEILNPNIVLDIETGLVKVLNRKVK